MLAKPFLQVALDYVNGDEALDIARAIQAYVDIFDIGTLLLKREGSRIIRAFKDAFPTKLVYADTKTLDLGRLEARMAFEAGADMMSVCGVASDETIELALKEAQLRHKAVVIDLIGLEASFRQIKRLTYFQPDYVMIHTGVDEWHQENTLFQKIEIIAQICPVPLIFSGGIQLDDIPYLLVFHPAIIVIGSSISKAADPVGMARHFRESIYGVTALG